MFNSCKSAELANPGANSRQCFVLAAVSDVRNVCKCDSSNLSRFETACSKHQPSVFTTFFSFGRRCRKVRLGVWGSSKLQALGTGSPGFTTSFLQGAGKRCSECGVQVQCCFTSTETVRTTRDGEPRATTSSFTQLLRPDLFAFSVALRPQRPQRLFN